MKSKKNGLTLKELSTKEKLVIIGGRLTGDGGRDSRLTGEGGRDNRINANGGRDNKR